MPPLQLWKTKKAKTETCFRFTVNSSIAIHSYRTKAIDVSPQKNTHARKTAELIRTFAMCFPFSKPCHMLHNCINLSCSTRTFILCQWKLETLHLYFRLPNCFHGGWTRNTIIIYEKKKNLNYSQISLNVFSWL